MEPVIVVGPADNFLQDVRELCTQKNVILIFDEMVTGFRWSLGGAQEYFDVIPDLATFGKGMANGMPLTALVGKRKYMRHIESIFFSRTQQDVEGLREGKAIYSCLFTVLYIVRNLVRADEI